MLLKDEVEGIIPSEGGGHGLSFQSRHLRIKLRQPCEVSHRDLSAFLCEIQPA